MARLASESAAATLRYALHPDEAGVQAIEATFAAYAFNAYLLFASSTLVLILYWPRKRPLTGALSGE